MGVEAAAATLAGIDDDRRWSDWKAVTEVLRAVAARMVSR